MAKYDVVNMYIANRNRAGDGGGSDLNSRVSALELTVDGDSTASPPVPGLEDRVDDLERKTPIASVTADGVKTNAQLIAELAALIPSGVHPKTLKTSVFEFSLAFYDNGAHGYSSTYGSTSGKIFARSAIVAANASTNSYFEYQFGGSTTDLSSTVATEGEIFALYEY